MLVSPPQKHKIIEIYLLDLKPPTMLADPLKSGLTPVHVRISECDQYARMRAHRQHAYVSMLGHTFS